MGMLQLLQLSPLDPEQKEQVDAALTSSRSLLTIISDILDFSKVEAGKLQLVLQPFMPSELLGSVSRIFADQAAKKGLELRCDLDPGLPEQVVGDSARLRQVLFNLLGNAIKFTERGRVELRAFEQGPATEGSLRLGFTVTDTGVGIPPETLDNLFEPFTQGDGSYTRCYQGTGLGLAIVKRLVELMGGEVRLESPSGGGTTVRFHVLVRLPDKRAEAPAVRLPVPERLDGFHVLLVEDEPTNAMAVAGVLRKKGAQVELAHNGREALQRLRRHSFDLVIMDIQMPEMDGVEATRVLRTDPAFRHVADIPVIALTAHALKGDEQKFLDAGMTAYLPKPMDTRELLGIIGGLERRG
jgi:CheY-like chemotaxis protein